MWFQFDIYDEYTLTLGSRKRDYIFYGHFKLQSLIILMMKCCVHRN